jgi:cytidine deaminase
MEEKRSSNFQYTEYSGVDALPGRLKELAQKAYEALASSYSPYSQFAVGAAVLLQNGEIVLGSNQENGAYPSGLCAERVALFYAGAAYPKVPVEAIAVTARYKDKIIPEPVAPCGGCRQVMMETQNIGKKPYKVIMVGAKRVFVVDDVKYLLPFTFSNIDDAIKE